MSTKDEDLEDYWEDYFEDYVRKHPNMEFTKVAEHLAKKLGISLDEIVSDMVSSNIIDHIWDTEMDMSATELIDLIAEARGVTVEKLLLAPEGMEAINNFYKKRSLSEPDAPGFPHISMPSEISQSVRTQSGANDSFARKSPSDVRWTSGTPSGEQTANISQFGKETTPKSSARSKTSAARVAAFVEIPSLIAGTMKIIKPWQNISNGIDAIVKQVAGRLGQNKFRRDLFENYGCRCLITECHVSHVVEAAHIKPYKHKGDFLVGNGLLLRSDLHMLFDQNLLAFHPDTWKVELHSKLMDTEYKHLTKEFLKVGNAPIQPNRESLQERYDAFLKAQTTVDYSYAEVEQ